MIRPRARVSPFEVEGCCRGLSMLQVSDSELQPVFPPSPAEPHERTWLGARINIPFRLNLSIQCSVFMHFRP